MKGMKSGTRGGTMNLCRKRTKHLLWHGNTEEALERLGDLLMELSLIEARSNAAKKVVDGLDDFRTYISNNREFIPNFGERRRQGETISTAFVESTINQVVSRIFARFARPPIVTLEFPFVDTRSSALAIDKTGTITEGCSRVMR